jgi:hypothetical protein
MKTPIALIGAGIIDANLQKLARQSKIHELRNLKCHFKFLKNEISVFCAQNHHGDGPVHRKLAAKSHHFPITRASVAPISAGETTT